MLEKVILPALKQDKISGTVAIANAPPGDIPAGQAEMDTILERFKSDGVKTILAEGGSIALVGQRLAQTTYRPRLVATNEGALASYVNTPGSDQNVLQGALTGNVGYPYNDPTLTKCRDAVGKATGETMVETPKPGEPSYRTSAEIACRYVPLFAELAKAAGKNLTTASFGKAGEKAKSVDVPGSGSIAYNAKTHSFAQPVFLARYNPATKTIVNDTEPVGANASTAK